MPNLEPIQDDQVQEKEQTKPWINGFYAVLNGEVKDMIIDHGPVKGTVNKNGPFPNTIDLPIGKIYFKFIKEINLMKNQMYTDIKQKKNYPSLIMMMMLQRMNKHLHLKIHYCLMRVTDLKKSVYRKFKLKLTTQYNKNRF